MNNNTIINWILFLSVGFAFNISLNNCFYYLQVVNRKHQNFYDRNRIVTLEALDIEGEEDIDLPQIA